MLCLDEIPQELKSLHQQTRDAAAALLPVLEAFGERRRIPAASDLLQGEPGWFFLHDGFFRLQWKDRPIRFYFNGDLFSVRSRESTDEPRSLSSEFGAELTWISRPALEKLLAGDGRFCRAWLDWQELELRLTHGLVAVFSGRDVRPAMQMRHFKFGELLIREGDPANGIYQLIDGEVRVTVRGVEVGRLGAGEILGEISFLTEQPRIATVSARTNCLAQFIDRQDFLLMMRYKPQTVLAMARSLAERIARLNDRFVDSRGV